jgi:cytochrome c oxidase subunit 2
MYSKHLKRVLLATALVIGGLSSQVVRAQDAPQKIEVTAKRFAFEPSEITVKKGQPVVLVLKSADAAHGVRFSDLNVNVKVKAGGTSEVNFTPQKSGDFVGHCSVFCGSGHGSMALKLHVVD